MKVLYPKYVFKNQICNAGNRKETFNNRGDIGRRDDYNHYLPCYRSKCSSSGRADKMGVCLSGADARQDEMAKSGVAGVGDIIKDTKEICKRMDVNDETGTFEDTASDGDNIITGGRKKKDENKKKK